MVWNKFPVQTDMQTEIKDDAKSHGFKLSINARNEKARYVYFNPNP